MFENSTVPQTIIKQISDDTNNEICKWSISKNEEKSLTIKLENIHLRQEPHETLDLTLSISTLRSGTPKIFNKFSPDYCSEHILENDNYRERYWKTYSVYQYIYTLELQFHNCLHAFDKTYVYEIACQIPREKFERTDTCFFYCVEPRLNDTLKITSRISLVENKELKNLEKMYFWIRRHNGQKTNGNERKMCNIIQKLRTVGCDVVLEASDGRIPTHKLVLSQNSDVFSNMFTHQMKEEQSGVVNMSDFETKVIKKMLDYLYTGVLGELGDMMISLFRLAHLYQFNELCHCCQEYYIFNVKPNNENIVDILELAKFYDLKELEKCANYFAVKHEQELSQVRSYQQYLCKLINRENVISMLLLSLKYNMQSVKISALDFIKANYDAMIDNEEFMKLFESNPKLMKEMYIYSCTK